MAFRPAAPAGDTPPAGSGAPRAAEPPREVRQERLAAAQFIARALAPADSRRLTGNSKEEQELLRLAASLRAPGASLENPCLERTGPFCTRTVLEPFFSALDGLRTGPQSSPVKIAAFGNSLIAGDRIVDIVRDQFVRRFGDGGRGLLLIDRLAPYGPRTRTGTADGWAVHTVGELKESAWPFGLSGVVHVSSQPHARSRFNLSGESKGTLFWLDQNPGPLELRVDGQPLLQTKPQNEGQHQQADFTLPPGAKTLELIAHQRGTALQGLALDKSGPGIILDTLGVPSADASLFLRADEAMVADQLRARAPSLVLVMLGGNEVKRLQWKRSTSSQVERDLRLFLQRVTRATPTAACLVVGPVDAVLGPEATKPFQQREHLEEVIGMEREIALEEGCAFFDMFAAMGGTGAIQRFHTQGLMHDDLVHPKGRGLDVLGALLANGLLRSWEDTPRTEPSAALAQAWVTLLGVELLSHGAHPSPQARGVALLPGEPEGPWTAGIRRVLDRARGPTPWLSLAGPSSLKCATLVPRLGVAADGSGCLPVTPPPVSAGLQDPFQRGSVVGAWLLAELVRYDTLASAWQVP
ncbi:GDSL-type esterase/lipase family protein [Stigmatella sp. ncwal1]|uniref:GDSL-type esterase/lipase family protein n=1 Tax=Stigmatella ashevillensis TaxID=2995309 RepID=A0ABT5DML0_9BACT|nr:GDSL-type esterase/lipase family protein [Stigmatella ashevillena]MDC0714833.1 GDSL-type esterase/lipase family protein [Stigmatella ashevillena]